MGQRLKIAKAQAVLTLTGTSASTGEVTVSQTNIADLPPGGSGLLAGMQFVVATTVGGLTAGVTYWILRITGSSTFTVSATDLSSNVSRTAVTLTTTSGQSVSVSVGVADPYFNNPVSGSGYPANNTLTYSVVGGDTAIYGKQVSAVVAISRTGTGTITVTTSSNTLTGIGTDFANTNGWATGTAIALADGRLVGYIANGAASTATTATLTANSLVAATSSAFNYANDETGYIVRQKGKTKYLVKGLTTGLIGPCYTANVANAVLGPGQMTITATYANTATAYVQSLTNHSAEIYGGDATLANSSPSYASFNTAAAADPTTGQPYPIVTITNS